MIVPIQYLNLQWWNCIILNLSILQINILLNPDTANTNRGDANSYYTGMPSRTYCIDRDYLIGDDFREWINNYLCM